MIFKFCNIKMSVHLCQCDWSERINKSNLNLNNLTSSTSIWEHLYTSSSLEKKYKLRKTRNWLGCKKWRVKLLHRVLGWPNKMGNWGVFQEAWRRLNVSVIPTSWMTDFSMLKSYSMEAQLTNLSLSERLSILAVVASDWKYSGHLVKVVKFFNLMFFCE